MRLNAFNGSIEIWERLSRLHPEVAEYQIHLAANLHDLGILLEASGQSNEAERVFQRALTTQEKLLERDPENLGLRSNLGDTLDSLAILYRAQAKRDGPLILTNVPSTSVRRRLACSRIRPKPNVTSPPASTISRFFTKASVAARKQSRSTRGRWNCARS